MGVSIDHNKLLPAEAKLNSVVYHHIITSLKKLKFIHQILVVHSSHARSHRRGLLLILWKFNHNSFSGGHQRRNAAMSNSLVTT